MTSQTTVVTTRRVLERLAVIYVSQRMAWKLLKGTFYPSFFKVMVVDWWSYFNLPVNLKGKKECFYSYYYKINIIIQNLLVDYYCKLLMSLINICRCSKISCPEVPEGNAYHRVLLQS